MVNRYNYYSFLLETSVSRSFSSPGFTNVSVGIMSLQEKFDAAAQSVKDMKTRPTDTELLELYALYKQAIGGDCNIDKPGMTDLKGKAKWEAWNEKKGMGQDAAKEAYCIYANTLITKY